MNGPDRSEHRRGLAALALLLAACGGGGDADNVAVAAAPAAPASAAATCGVPDFVETTLARVNAQRARGADCGSRGSFAPAPPLAWNNALAAAAAAHSSDMAARDYFAHDSPDGGTLAERADAAGYRWRALAENIAAGYRSIDAVTDAWIGSPGHCANVMQPSLRDVGMACVASDSASYPTYWTMDFGEPR